MDTFCAEVGQVATHSSFRFQAGAQCIHESVSELVVPALAEYVGQ